MRCVIARYPFDLYKSDVQQRMQGVTPEPVTGASVVVNQLVYPVMQVGEAITRQDRRDFSSGEVTRALVRLGFTCHSVPAATPAPALTPLESAAAMLGSPPRD